MLVLLCLLCLAWLLAALWCYPLVFSFRWDSFGCSVQWLPRVFAGCAPGCALRLRRAEQDARRWPAPLLRRLTWLLLRKIALQHLRFAFAPGLGQLSCIFSLRLGDIMASSIRAAAAYAAIGRKNERRA